jgi:hypothetical protein
MYYLLMLGPVCRDKLADLTGWTCMPFRLVRTFRRDFQSWIFNPENGFSF